MADIDLHPIDIFRRATKEKVSGDKTDLVIQVSESGSSNQESLFFTDAVGTTAIDLPASEAGVIRKINVICESGQSTSNKLQISIDGGSTYIPTNGFLPSEGIEWDLKGSITQIKLKGSVAGVKYSALINRDT